MDTGNLVELCNRDNQAVLGNLADSVMVAALGNQAEVVVDILPELVPQSLGEEVVASCSPHQEGGT